MSHLQHVTSHSLKTIYNLKLDSETTHITVVSILTLHLKEKL